MYTTNITDWQRAGRVLICNIINQIIEQITAIKTKTNKERVHSKPNTEHNLIPAETINCQISDWFRTRDVSSSMEALTQNICNKLLKTNEIITSREVAVRLILLIKDVWKVSSEDAVVISWRQIIWKIIKDKFNFLNMSISDRTAT